MAMCDAKYCFTLVDVGNYGKDIDAQIFNNSAIGRAFLNNEMHIPLPNSINGHSLPYVIVVDEIFGLKPWLMKPFPGKGLTETHAIFNYRLSRAQRTIECIWNRNGKVAHFSSASAVHRSRKAGAGVLTYFAGAGVCSPPVKL